MTKRMYGTEIVEAATEMRANGMSYRKIARELGTSHQVISYWLDHDRRERVKSGIAAWRSRNPDYDKDYRAANKEALAQREAERIQEDPDRHRRACRKYRELHPDKVREKERRYREKYPEKVTAKEEARRARKMASSATLSLEQKEQIEWIYRQAQHDRSVRCYLCGKLIPLGKRHVDHVVPLARGGEHRPSNLAIACDKCNQKKGAKMPEEIGRLL